MRDGLGLRLELKLHDSRGQQCPGRRRAAPARRQRARRSAGPRPDHGRRAFPVRHTGSRVASPRSMRRYPGQAAPPVRLLPTDLAPAALAPLYRAPERVVIGQREEDLAPVTVDFADNPLLMVFGDTKSGKTTLLRHLIRTIRENSHPDRVAFTVIDRRLQLVDEPLFADNEYTPNIDRVLPAMLGLSALIEKRRPPAGLSAAELQRLDVSRTHALPDHRRCRPDSRQPGGQRPLRRPAAVDPAARPVGAGIRSRSAGDRDRQGRRLGPRGDDRAAAAPPQRSAGHGR